VIVLGDLNVAHLDIDIHTTKGHSRSAGFTKEERNAFSSLLSECELTDTFRFLYPDKREYTYFSNFAKSRENNKGWLIDRILISNNLVNTLRDTCIYGKYKGSDHVVVMSDLDI
jgi:exodeoxyribonuclease-3